MAAAGDLFIFGIYILTAVPLIWGLIRLFRNRRAPGARLFATLALASIPLIAWSAWMYYVRQSNQLDRVGSYQLVAFPDCDPCVLTLSPDNSYVVTEGDKAVEQGTWEDENGGDYWAVRIGESGQLGSGKYTYSTFLRSRGD